MNYITCLYYVRWLSYVFVVMFTQVIEIDGKCLSIKAVDYCLQMRECCFLASRFVSCVHTAIWGCSSPIFLRFCPQGVFC